MRKKNEKTSVCVRKRKRGKEEKWMEFSVTENICWKSITSNNLT